MKESLDIESRDSLIAYRIERAYAAFRKQNLWQREVSIMHL